MTDPDTDQQAESDSERLWAGRERARNGQQSGEVTMNDQPPLKGSDHVGGGLAALRRFAKDLTYAEVHAFVVGLVPLVIAGIPGAIIPVPATARAAFVGVAVSLALLAAGLRKLKRPSLRYVVGEPHYLYGGQGIAAAILVLTYTVVHLVGILGGLV